MELTLRDKYRDVGGYLTCEIEANFENHKINVDVIIDYDESFILVRNHEESGITHAQKREIGEQFRIKMECTRIRNIFRSFRIITA